MFIDRCAHIHLQRHQISPEAQPLPALLPNKKTVTTDVNKLLYIV